MKNLLIILFAAIISFYFFLEIPSKKEKEILMRKTISFSFVGDLMCHAPQFESARVSQDSFDFNPVYSEIKEILSKSDYTIGNLETVIGGRELRYSGYPMFNTPEEYIRALKNAGFDILVTSNNHSLDRGIKGVFNTIDNLKKYDLLSFGTYKTEKDSDSILIVEKNGIKIALLAYTYGLNGNNLSKDYQYSVKQIDTLQIKKEILKAKGTNVDLIITYFHFGEEYQQEPNNFQKDIVARTIKYGADLIIASHPHVIQTIELFENEKSKLDQGFVAYSLGNFFSNQRWRYSNCGVVLNFTIEKINNKLVLDTVSIEPVWVSKENVKGKYEYKLIPSDTVKYKNFRKLNKIEKNKLVQSYYDTKNILRKVESFKRKSSRHIN